MSDAVFELKRCLLKLLGGMPAPLLDEDAWVRLNGMAQQHRLQPLLAWQIERSGLSSSVPLFIKASWREARLAAGLATLKQQAALRLAGAELDKAGIRYVALKGPRLAWACYPEPALRPMRDIDILVAPDAALPAIELLRGTGFVSDANEKMVSEALVEHKHLPPLWHEGLGVAVELHHRLVEPQGSQAYRVPQLDPAVMLSTSEQEHLAGTAFPCPAYTELLSHLIVHALYSHRLDCGPLILADIHFLLATGRVSSTELEKAARDGGWIRGAGLLLALTEHYFGEQPLRLSVSPPSEVISAAEEALLQDFGQHEHGAALVDLLAARSLSAFARALVKRLKPSEGVLHREGAGATALQFWPVWAWRRVCRVASRFKSPRATDEGLSALAMMRWLQG